MLQAQVTAVETEARKRPEAPYIILVASGEAEGEVLESDRQPVKINTSI